MKHVALGHRLPGFLSTPLFGDRKRFGLEIRPDDPCWQKWERIYFSTYQMFQRDRMGSMVTDWGYRIMDRIDLSGKNVLEIGAGDVEHMKCWRGRPNHFTVTDRRGDMLDSATAKLEAAGIPFSTTLVEEGEPGSLPFPDSEFDVVISFYVLEHLYPLTAHLDGLLRVLKPGGVLIGAIPTEGGLAWGSGRFAVTRRWILKNTDINPDKIICWEHPNYADFILETLDRRLKQEHLSFHPFHLPIIDMNLILSFVYAKNGQDPVS